MIIDTHTNDEWKHKRFHVGLKHTKCILNEFKRCKHAKENRKENWQNSQSKPLNEYSSSSDVRYTREIAPSCTSRRLKPRAKLGT